MDLVIKGSKPRVCIRKVNTFPPKNLLTAKIGGGPKKNFLPQHKKGITVPNPDATTEWTPVDPNTYLLQRGPPRQAS